MILDTTVILGNGFCFKGSLLVHCWWIGTLDEKLVWIVDHCLADN